MNNIENITEVEQSFEAVWERLAKEHEIEKIAALKFFISGFGEALRFMAKEFNENNDDQHNRAFQHM